MLGSAKEEGVWRVEPGTGAVYGVVDDADGHFERSAEHAAAGA